MIIISVTKNALTLPVLHRKTFSFMGVDYFLFSEVQLGSSMPFLNLSFTVGRGVLPQYHLHECRILQGTLICQRFSF